MGIKQNIITETTLVDDYSKKELPADTLPRKFSLGSKSYRLYLSEESNKAVNKFLADLLEDAEIIGAKRKKNKTAPKAKVASKPKATKKPNTTQVPAFIRQQRLEAYNKANGKNKAKRYSPRVEAWAIENNVPDLSSGAKVEKPDTKKASKTTKPAKKKAVVQSTKKNIKK